MHECECALRVLQICKLLDMSKTDELGLPPAQIQSELDGEPAVSLCVHW